MSILFTVNTDSGRTLYGTLQQITASGTLGTIWNQNTSAYEANPATNDRKINLTEGTAPNTGSYTGGRAAAGTYTGFLLKRIHDANLSNEVIGSSISYVVAGAETRQLDSSDITALNANVVTTMTAAQAAATDTGVLVGRLTSGRATNLDNLTASSSSILTQATNGATSAATAATQATTAATQATNAAADAATLITRLTSGRATNLDNLNASVSAVATSASTAATQSTAAAGDAATLVGRLTSGRATNLDNLTASSSSILTQATNSATSAATAATQATNAAADAATAIARLTATRAGYLDNLSAGPVAQQASVLAITNSTLIKISAASEIQIPPSGSTVVAIDLLLYDSSGNMEAPDSTPTFTAANQSAVDRSANLGSVTNIGTGHYRTTYTVSSAHAEEQIIITATAVEGGNSLVQTHIINVVVLASGGGFAAADRTKLEGIFNKLPSKPFLTSSSASNGDIDLDAADGDRNQFKADVSTLATSAALTTVGTNVSSTLTQATNAATSAAAAATSGATLEGRLTSGRATNLDNLNSSVSGVLTQATTAATQATTAATQATTAATHATTLEGRLTAGRATNLDNLNATVSSRSTFVAATDGVTLLAGHGLATLANQTAIKAKTDNLPASPAAVSDIPSAATIASTVDTTLTTNHPGNWAATSDATLANQNSILAQLGQIQPAPPSPIQVSESRTWRLRSAEGEDSLSPNIIHLPTTFDGTLAMDFTELLNPGTSLASFPTATDLSGNGLVPTDRMISPDRRKAHFDVASMQANKRYEIRVTVTTTDGQTLSGRGYIRT